MKARGRTVAILATVLLIGGAGAAAFRFETQRKSAPPLIGVVHETEIRIAPGNLGQARFHRCQSRTGSAQGRDARDAVEPGDRGLAGGSEGERGIERAPISPMSRRACARKSATPRRRMSPSPPPTSPWPSSSSHASRCWRRRTTRAGNNMTKTRPLEHGRGQSRCSPTRRWTRPRLGRRRKSSPSRRVRSRWRRRRSPTSRLNSPRRR